MDKSLIDLTIKVKRGRELLKIAREQNNVAGVNRMRRFGAQMLFNIADLVWDISKPISTGFAEQQNEQTIYMLGEKYGQRFIDPYVKDKNGVFTDFMEDVKLDKNGVAYNVDHVTNTWEKRCDTLVYERIAPIGLNQIVEDIKLLVN
jgi:hypothetical protein